ncbi:MAG: hypothetical protein JXP34_10610, partial [Planctomycetes bacterium]|nr:hypothetical protein [Planctomycetota bacterium]
MADSELTRREFVGRSVAAAGGVVAGARILGGEVDPSKILNFNSNMEYRRCGKTNLMVSAVCLGGHWKRVNLMVPGLFQGSKWLSADVEDPGFMKNRADVVSRCIELGVNYIDACTIQEVQTYSAALKGRREKMYLGCSWYQNEMRNAKFRTKDALLGT